MQPITPIEKTHINANMSDYSLLCEYLLIRPIIFTFSGYRQSGGGGLHHEPPEPSHLLHRIIFAY